MKELNVIIKIKYYQNTVKLTTYIGETFSNSIFLQILSQSTFTCLKWKHYKKVRNMFKVNNKDTTTTARTSVISALLLALNKFHPFSSVSIVDFETSTCWLGWKLFNSQSLRNNTNWSLTGLYNIYFQLTCFLHNIFFLNLTSSLCKLPLHFSFSKIFNTKQMIFATLFTFCETSQTDFSRNISKINTRF